MVMGILLESDEEAKPLNPQKEPLGVKSLKLKEKNLKFLGKQRIRVSPGALRGEGKGKGLNEIKGTAKGEKALIVKR